MRSTTRRIARPRPMTTSGSGDATSVHCGGTEQIVLSSMRSRSRLPDRLWRSPTQTNCRSANGWNGWVTRTSCAEATVWSAFAGELQAARGRPVPLAEDRGRGDASVGRAALGAARRPRLAARARSEGHAGAEAAGLTCDIVNQGEQYRRKVPRIMVSSRHAAGRRRASRRSRNAEGDADRRADPQRTAGPDHQGIAAPSLRPSRRDACRTINCCSRSKTSSRARRARLRKPRQDRPAERAAATRKRRANRGALPPHLPRIETIVDVEDKTCPCCRGELAPDRRGRQREARCRPGAVPSAGRAPTQIRLPRLRGRRRPGAGAGAADRRRPADRGDGRPRAGRQVCRSPAALSPGADLRAPGRSPRSLDARRLGRTRCVPSAARP